uniref:Uncharacterized protein n=1 Tax=Coturnix japonica TaxID=93934 RepID=A0A8C2Y6D3_COTJA
MELELRGAGGEFLARLEPDDALLGSFPVSDGCGLHDSLTSNPDIGLGSAMMSRWANTTAGIGVGGCPQ